MEPYLLTSNNKISLIELNFFFPLFLLSCIWIIFTLVYPQSDLADLSDNAYQSPVSLPDFSGYSDVKQKKIDFFSFLYPLVEAENQHIQSIRDSLETLKNKSTKRLNSTEHAWLNQLATNYRVKTTEVAEQLAELTLKVDTLPTSLVLAQAAIESGWGTSRFAKQGNNLFGQWCFKKGCGIVPQHRANDQTHEVASFSSINESIKAYMSNLNSFPAYQKLRDLRAAERTKRTKVSGASLVGGLERYSEQGKTYTDKVFKMMRQNKLEQYSKI